MYEDKAITEPIKKEKLGKILHKAGVFIPSSPGSNSGQTPANDIIEGYVLETSYNMLKQSEEAMRIECRKLIDQVQNLKNKTVTDDEQAENNDHLNLNLDIRRIEKLIRRLDKRSRKSKDDDVTVRCANAIGLLEGKKLLLIQAVTHKR